MQQQQLNFAPRVVCSEVFLLHGRGYCQLTLASLPGVLLFSR